MIKRLKNNSGVVIRYILLILPIFVALFSNAYAQEESEDKAWNIIRMRGLPAGSYHITSGTGFFINGGLIVTNAHVVNHCATISIRGAVDPSPAKLIAIDKTHDLALLSAGILPNRSAYLRMNSGLKPGDLVFVIGYPLEHGMRGDYILVQSSIVGVEGKFDDSEHIEIDGGVDHGNSGGPLIDKNGNVIGVIVAKATVSAQEGMATVSHTLGIAIGLNTLEQFLNEHEASYNANSSYDLFTEYRPDRIASQYIVNIQCVQQ